MTRPRPAGLRPTFCYTIFADVCSREFHYAFASAELTSLVESAHAWMPEEPSLHTSHATLDVTWPGSPDVLTLPLTGSEHRQLEDEGTFDDLLIRIAGGEKPEQALAALTT